MSVSWDSDKGKLPDISYMQDLENITMKIEPDGSAVQIKKEVKNDEFSGSSSRDYNCEIKVGTKLGCTSFKSDKQEYCIENFEESQEDPLAIYNHITENVKKEYSYTENVKKEFSTDVLEEHKCEDIKHSIDIVEYKADGSANSNHSVSQDDGRASTCQECYKLFFHHVGFEKHLNSAYKKTIKYEYEQYRGRYSTLNIIKKHNICTHTTKTDYKRNVQEKKKVYECYMCKKNFTQEWKLKRHIVTVHDGIRNYECELCKKLFSQLEDLRKHINTVHMKIKNYECKKCQKTFFQSGGLKTHIIAVHESVARVAYECEECKKNFIHFRFLKNHINTVHLGIKNYKCKKCEKYFTESGGLRNHIRAVHEGVTYMCEKCKKSFSHLRTLKLHINSVHLRLENYECKSCRKTFTTSACLQNHIRAAHEGVKYECERCGRSFTQLCHIKKHISTVHMKIKNYACKICRKTFTETRDLKNHIIAVHEGVTYMCEECQKSFVHLVNLKQHINTVHLRIKNSECKKCQKMFTTLGNLKKHVRTVHEGVKYERKECKKSFT